MAGLLPEAEIEKALRAVPHWRREADSLVRTFALGNFVEAVEFVNEVTEIAEEVNHHPDVDIRWNKVTLRISTHSKGGLTRADFDLAARVDGLSL